MTAAASRKRKQDKSPNLESNEPSLAVSPDMLNSIRQGDCVTGMSEMPAGSIDLVFADPPFNIGYEYDVYNDQLGREKYLDWSREWISEVHRVLKPDGTFWLAIGDEYAAELKVLSQEIGFHSRSWVVWYYTFGVNCKYKFTRSHAHLFYFVKDSANFTFLSEDLENRIPSARELVYNDKRANPKGRLPDDTWIIRPSSVLGDVVTDDGTWSPEDVRFTGQDDETWTLRPQDIENCFRAAEDTWYFPRVAGTFKERQGFHGCQMPEQLLGRIIRCCSNERSIVLDPFSGSATTLAVAKKLNRQFVGFELSEDYVTYGRERLGGIRIGDRLDGSAEPTKSAPKTTDDQGAFYKSQSGRKSKQQQALFEAEERLAHRQLEVTLNGVAEAFLATHRGHRVERCVLDPELNAAFIESCRKLGLAGDQRAWNTLLFRLIRSGQFANVDWQSEPKMNWSDVDRFLFASEIALGEIVNSQRADWAEEVFSDPFLARQFDWTVATLGPPCDVFEARWAALMISRQAPLARTRGCVLSAPAKMGRPVRLFDVDVSSLPEASAAYLISEREHPIYVGETLNLARRVEAMRVNAQSQAVWGEDVDLQWFLTESSDHDFLAWQSCLARTNQPKLNVRSLYGPC